jgi:hypothetical protein
MEGVHQSHFQTHFRLKDTLPSLRLPICTIPVQAILLSSKNQAELSLLNSMALRPPPASSPPTAKASTFNGSKEANYFIIKVRQTARQ